MLGGDVSVGGAEVGLQLHGVSDGEGREGLQPEGGAAGVVGAGNLAEPKARMPWISDAQITSCFLNWRQTNARTSRRSGICCSYADPRSENGIQRERSLAALDDGLCGRARPGRAKRPGRTSVRGLGGIVSSARGELDEEKASPSRWSMVAIGRDSQRTMMPSVRRGCRGGNLGGGRGAGETRSWRFTMAGPHRGAGARDRGLRTCPRGDLAEHGAGLECSGGDGDHLAAGCRGTPPDEKPPCSGLR